MNPSKKISFGSFFWKGSAVFYSWIARLSPCAPPPPRPPTPPRVWSQRSEYWSRERLNSFPAAKKKGFRSLRPLLQSLDLLAGVDRGKTHKSPLQKGAGRGSPARRRGLSPLASAAEGRRSGVLQPRRAGAHPRSE